MRYGVFDSETTIRNVGEGAIGSLSASPFHPDNFMVAYGELALKKGKPNKRLRYRNEGEELELPWFLSTPDPVLMIGTNLPFDLKWLWREWPEEFFAKLPTLHIWDIQQAEYLLSGQTEKFASLDGMSAARGLPAKQDVVKTEYWEKGIDTPFVPKEVLLDYLGSADIENPLEIFHDQWGELQSQPKLLLLAKLKMDDILLTTLMEIFGMQFDLEFASEKADELDGKIEELRKRLSEAAQPFFKDGFEFDPDSKDHVSLAVYGGQYKLIESVPVRDESGNVVRFKGGMRKGEVKTRKEKVVYTTKGFKLKPGIAPKMKNGLYSTEYEYLLPHAETSAFVKDVLDYREMAKDLNTYYRGYSKFVYPDGRIHANFNHAATETGRLSMSQPNLQNVTKDE